MLVNRYVAHALDRRKRARVTIERLLRLLLSQLVLRLLNQIAFARVSRLFRCVVDEEAGAVVFVRAHRLVPKGIVPDLSRDWAFALNLANRVDGFLLLLYVIVHLSLVDNAGPFRELAKEFDHCWRLLQFFQGAHATAVLDVGRRLTFPEAVLRRLWGPRWRTMGTDRGARLVLCEALSDLIYLVVPRVLLDRGIIQESFGSHPVDDHLRLLGHLLDAHGLLGLLGGRILSPPRSTVLRKLLLVEALLNSSLVLGPNALVLAIVL